MASPALMWPGAEALLRGREIGTAIADSGEPARPSYAFPDPPGRDQSAPGSAQVGATHGGDEDLGHLGPAELGRRLLAGPEHLPNLGPAERHAHAVVVGA